LDGGGKQSATPLKEANGRAESYVAAARCYRKTLKFLWLHFIAPLR